MMAKVLAEFSISILRVVEFLTLKSGLLSSPASEEGVELVHRKLDGVHTPEVSLRRDTQWTGNVLLLGTTHDHCAEEVARGTPVEQGLEHPTALLLLLAKPEFTPILFRRHDSWPRGTITVLKR